MFKTLDDYKNKEEKGDKKKTESYTGGEKSGMAVENPDDISEVLKKAKVSNDYDGEKPETEIRITLYQNGFTVEGGEFRDYNTPENKEFMKELNDGYIPKDLRAKYNKPIGIALEDKRETKYRPPTPPKYVAYSGEGMSIGQVQGIGG